MLVLHIHLSGAMDRPCLLCQAPRRPGPEIELMVRRRISYNYVRNQTLLFSQQSWVLSVDGKLIQWGLGAYFCAKDFFIHENNWVLKNHPVLYLDLKLSGDVWSPLPPCPFSSALCVFAQPIMESPHCSEPREPWWLPNHRGRGTNPLAWEVSPDWHCPCRSPKCPRDQEE